MWPGPTAPTSPSPAPVLPGPRCRGDVSRVTHPGYEQSDPVSEPICLASSAPRGGRRHAARDHVRRVGRRRRPRTRRVVAPPRGRPGHGRRAPGPRHRARAVHVALLGADDPRRSSPRSRPPGWRAPPSSCSRCRCGSARSRSSSRRPAAGSSHADAQLVVIDAAARRVPRSGSRATRRSCSSTSCRGRAGRRTSARADDPDALAILQFTSGSTADPKGVMLPHRCIEREPRRRPSKRAGLDAEADTVVSWLPLYHDMGLIGLLEHRR